MNFKSDNTVSVNPEILQALVDVNKGSDGTYGADQPSIELKKNLEDIFETEVDFFLCSTGTAANSLCMKTTTPSYGVILATACSHINTDETSAPEFYTGGAKIKEIPDQDGLMRPEYIKGQIEHLQAYAPHAGLAKTISVTQSTELGTVYEIDHLKEISEIAKKYNLSFHMDGARFTNALVNLNCSAADMTWKSGVDLVSLGATKNGGLMGEMILVFNKKLLPGLEYMHKQAGQLMSKTRYFAAQYNAWFKDDLWLKNARHANKMAQIIAQKAKSSDKCKLMHPVSANELFLQIPNELSQKLQSEGAKFYCWHDDVYRIVTNWETSESEVQKFCSFI